MCHKLSCGVYEMHRAVCTGTWPAGLGTKLCVFGTSTQRHHSTHAQVRLFVVSWLLDVSATCKAHLRYRSTFNNYTDRSCRSNLLSDTGAVYWHQAYQSLHWPQKTSLTTGLLQECKVLSDWSDWTWVAWSDPQSPALRWKEQRPHSRHARNKKKPQLL